MIAAEVLIESGAELGEGPLWLVEDGRLAWVDILVGEVHSATLDGADHRVTTLDVPVGAIAAAETGALVAAVPSGLVRVADGSHVASIDVDAPDVRMNDGKPDPSGRFVGGTMTLGEPRAGAGTLWSIDGAGARRLVPDVTISNGLAWSADGRQLFYVDTPTQRIDVLDYDPADGSVSDRRPWAHIDPRHGSPDGISIDADGGIWVALWGGSAVHRFVDGVLDTVVEVPVSQPTCPTFAGPELNLLVVTSASIGVDEPAAGHLFGVDVGVRGVAPFRLGSWAT
ncbi:MAG: SMP-30/gluconolactonase/LRE family protein [Actinomycetota bacterium]